MGLEARAFILRRNWWPILFCVASAVAGLLLLSSGGHLAPLGLFGVLYGVIFAPLFYAWGSFPLSRPVHISATENELTVGDMVLSAEDILETKLTRTSANEPRLDLLLRGGHKLSLRTLEQDAVALLRLLGVRRSAFRLRLPFTTRFFASFVGLALLFFLTGATSGKPPAFLLASFPVCLFWSLLLALALGVLRGRIIVGVDGFTTRWFLRDRFTAYRDVEHVTPGPTVRVDLVGQQKKRLHTVETPNTAEERHAESNALYMYLQEALMRARQATAVDIPALVRRGNRSTEDWLHGLDELARGGNPGYRVAAVSPALLASVANDPSAASDTRLGAAAALIRAGNEAQRVHVRIAAEACAEPDLREALLAMSDARDDESTRAALATLRR